MPTEEQTYRQSMKEQLDRIEADGKETKTQAKLTNGRVTKLERWQAYVFGFCAALTMLFLPILFMFIKRFV